MKSSEMRKIIEANRKERRERRETKRKLSDWKRYMGGDHAETRRNSADSTEPS